VHYALELFLIALITKPTFSSLIGEVKSELRSWIALGKTREVACE